MIDRHQEFVLKRMEMRRKFETEITLILLVDKAFFAAIIIIWLVKVL